ncbi:MAG: hypothetical protein LBB29_03065 [Holosporaceae bacterium]|jgi:hypothetical protein|nr:hypothetical protein [Holosporaceae bacterium]
MVKINKKKINIHDDDKDIKIDRNSIKASQYLEIATEKNVYIESIECCGMRILAKKIFLDGDIVSYGPVILAAMEICINKEVI